MVLHITAVSRNCLNYRVSLSFNEEDLSAKINMYCLDLSIIKLIHPMVYFLQFFVYLALFEVEFSL